MRELERSGYVTRKSLLGSLRSVLELKKCVSTVTVFLEIEITKKELLDVQLGLLTTVEWVKVTTQIREVSQACDKLLRRWSEVLDGAMGGE